eukprot:4133639-Prymnesium_polylepis.1
MQQLHRRVAELVELGARILDELRRRAQSGARRWGWGAEERRGVRPRSGGLGGRARALGCISMP